MKKRTTLFAIALLLCFSIVRTQTIELIGSGVFESPVTTLYITDLATVDYVVVEAIYKWGDTPPNGPVNFYDNDESYLPSATVVEAISTNSGWDYNAFPRYFTATFTSVGPEGITLDQMANYGGFDPDNGGIHSFLIYVYRNIPDAEFTSYIDYNHAFIFRNGESNPYEYVFNFPGAPGPRDIHLKTVISEMAYDDRPCYINVTAGSLLEQVVFTTPNMGNALNITPITLNDVPGDVTEVTVSIWSPPPPADGATLEFYNTVPPEGGDSFISGAVLLDVEEYEDPPVICTLTQGYYGNYGGMFNWQTTAELLTDLLATDLVIGSGNNKITFTQGDVDCLIGRLPGGGPPAILNGVATCSDPVGIALKKKSGRFHNIALAQTITMGLNLRLEYGPGSVLIEDLPFSLSSEITDYIGSGATVFDLYNLANQIMAGENINNINPGSIADALGAINDYYDECFIPPLKSGISDAQDTEISIQPVINVYPNPASDLAVVEVTAEHTAYSTIELYDLQGKRITTVFEGNVNAGDTYSTTFNVSDVKQGIYLLIMRNGEKMLKQKIAVN